jgi:hypothetical protein
LSDAHEALHIECACTGQELALTVRSWHWNGYPRLAVPTLTTVMGPTVYP